MSEIEWHGHKIKTLIEEISEHAIRKSAIRVTDKARANVAKRSGALAESIDYSLWNSKGVSGAIVFAGVKGKENYAGHVELGTPGTVFRPGRKKGKSRHKGRRPFKRWGQERTPIEEGPYLRPALKEEKKILMNSWVNKL
jgi:hypothetical protein